MQVNPINNKIASEIKKVQHAKKNRAPSGLEKKSIVKKPDSSNFSSEAKTVDPSKRDASIVETKLINESDTRIEKISEVKKKIESGYYNSPEFMDKLADKLAHFFKGDSSV